MEDNKQFEVTAEDLNAIDMMNGEGKVNKKANTINVMFKGALAKYNNSFSQYDELMFIKGILDQIYEYQVERFEYSNLPEGLTKYRLETKILENGSAMVINVNGEYHAVNYSVETTNIYNEPVLTSILEPKSSMLNGVKVDLRDKKAVIVRNNEKRETILPRILRFVGDMEKILFQIEKNITSSAPKGILNLKNTEMEFNEENNSPEKNAMEHVINGQDTFYVLRTKTGEEYDAMGDNEDSLFIPVELTDRTDTLIKNYTFMKEQIKEIVGAAMNIHQKKERAITDEIGSQQGFSVSAKQHAFNIRVQDLETLNKVFGLTVGIEFQLDTPPEEEQEKIDEEGKGEENEK